MTASLCPRRLYTVCRTASLLVVFAALSPNAQAESLASKNSEGNQLFAQGNYEGAEKAYLEAQGIDPGKPEVLYNLGNSLIKQNKYDQGIQSLRQSISTGDNGIKERSWYNTGNALFLAGRFKDSAEAYVQALRIDPSDRDAKYNLELALAKLKEQKQAAAQPPPPGSGKEKEKQAGNENKNGAGNEKDRTGSPQPQDSRAAPHAGAISREQALQMLDAMKSRELEEQRKLLERRAQHAGDKRDW